MALAVDRHEYLIEVPTPVTKTLHATDTLPPNVGCEHRTETVPPQLSVG